MLAFPRLRNSAKRRSEPIRFGLSLQNIGVAVTALLAMISGSDSTYASTKLNRSHAAMVADIRKTAQQDYPGLADEPIFKAVLEAIAHIDRTKFVSADQRPFANHGTALPIDFDQTISAPYVVAVMTAAVGARAGSNVLEVGTGSGYQAAVLSRLGASVHSLEIVPQLADSAARRLRRLRFGHAWIKAGDGFAGWREFAPYDAIIVTAGAAEVPEPLLDQLRPRGKLVMPIGANPFVEQLIVITREISGGFSRCSLGPFMFVPLTGIGRKAEAPGLYDRSVPLCRRGQTARWPGQASGDDSARVEGH